MVATEVGALAQRTATASKEIKLLIDDSTQRAASGAKLACRAGASMAEIVRSIGGVTSIMDQIVISTCEQSDGIRQVHQAISDMDGVTQQNAALAEESAVASETMREQACGDRIDADRLDEQAERSLAHQECGHQEHTARILATGMNR